MRVGESKHFESLYHADPTNESLSSKTRIRIWNIKTKNDNVIVDLTLSKYSIRKYIVIA